MSDSWKECEGQVVDGEFPLLQHLGGSDHSVVFLTQRGKNNPEKAAIKFVQADASNAALQLSRWQQAARISHPNLIKLFETGRCHLAGMDLLYIVMDYAQENLAQFLPDRALSPAETRDMLEPFLETLAYLHGKGFVHGRIKPGNILAIDDQLKLSSDSVSRSGEAPPPVEKPDIYTDPEIARGATAAADVWALGVTLVETLTQRPPEGKDREELQFPDSMPQPFLEIVQHSLRRDPQSRWTVAEISARLNPPATPPAPKTAAPAIPDPLKPLPAKQLDAAGTAGPANHPKTPVKPAASIDPLSVPLSTVTPLSALKQHALENQLVAGQSTSHRSYYIVIAVLVALTVGAMIAIPRLRDRQPEPDTMAAMERPSRPPDQPPAAARIDRPAQSNPQPLGKQTAPPPERSADGLEDRAAGETAKSTSVDSMKTASEKQFVGKEPPSNGSMAAAKAAPPSPALGSAAAAEVPASGAMTPGEALNQVLPEVSARSRSTIHGTVRVVVKVFVDASGNVTAAEPASSPSKFFGDAALQAAKRWDFAPAKIGTQSVPSQWLLRFDFTQGDTKVLPLQNKP
jgi:TonB family protein